MRTVPLDNEEQLRVVVKYIKNRQRSIILRASIPSFSPERALLFHIVPDDFDPLGSELKFRSFTPSVLVHGSGENDWKRRHTRYGFRLELTTPVRAFVNLLRSGAVEFGVTAGTEAGLDWAILKSTFTNSLYELADYVWQAPSKPRSAFLTLLVTDAAPHGMAGLPSGYTQGVDNSFEEKELRLGPLVLKAEDAGSSQFQPMFDLLFQCAGFHGAPSIHTLGFYS
jgi:hypothetical protein